MDALAISLWVIITVVWISPKSLGKWIAQVRKSYLDTLKDISHG